MEINNTHVTANVNPTGLRLVENIIPADLTKEEVVTRLKNILKTPVDEVAVDKISDILEVTGVLKPGQAKAFKLGAYVTSTLIIRRIDSNEKEKKYEVFVVDANKALISTGSAVVAGKITVDAVTSGIVVSHLPANIKNCWNIVIMNFFV